MRYIGTLFFLFLINTQIFAQTFKGIVLDNNTQLPLSGVNIITKDGKTGCSSNINGHFEIELNKSDTLLISHVGYEDRIFLPDFSGSQTIIYLEQVDILINDIQVSITKNNRQSFSQSASISYLSENQIQENVSRSMAEAMTTTAGVWMQKTNHGGGSPFVRGLTGNYTLILVDGIRLNNSTFRYGPNQYFNTISPFSVNSVEVLRGAGSTLYGSDAIGGTILVNTISPSFSRNKKIYGSVGGQVMSHEMEYSGNLELGGNSKKFAYIINGSIRNFGDIKAGKDLGFERPTAYSEKDLLFKAVWKMNDNQNISLNYQWLRQDDVPRYDKVAQDDYEYYFFTIQQRQLAYIRYEYDWFNSPLNSLQVTASYQQSNEERDTKKNSSDLSKNERDDVSTFGLNAQLNAMILKRIETNVGLDLYNDWIGSSKMEENTITGELINYPRGLYPDGSTSFSGAIYNTYLYNINNWAFQFGWRYNYALNKAEDELFNDLDLETSSVVWNGSVNYKFKNSRIFGAVNTAFRAPNINDISSLGDFDYGIEVPSTGLKPERSISYELGYKLAEKRINFNVSAYYSKIKDLIDRVPSTYNGDSLIDGSQVYTKANVGEAFVIGIETEFEVKATNHLSVIWNITYAYGQNINKDEPFRRIPPLFGDLSIRYHKNRYFVILQALAAGKQDRLSSGDIDDYRIPESGTPGWFVLNIKGGYEWKRIGVKLALNNILNEAYRMHGSGIDGYGFHLVGSIRFYF